MNNNQTLFSAITGYEGLYDFGSASTENWQNMSFEELLETIEAHAEHYNFKKGDYDAKKVAHVCLNYKNLEYKSGRCSADSYAVFCELDDEEDC